MAITTPTELYKICFNFIQDAPELTNPHPDLKNLDPKENFKKLRALFNDKFSIMHSSPITQTEKILPLKKRKLTTKTVPPKKRKFEEQENNPQSSSNENLIIEYQKGHSTVRGHSLLKTFNLNNPGDREFYNFSPGTTLKGGENYYPFFFPKGLCHGEVLYFIHLLFKEIDRLDPNDMNELEKIVLSIAEKFKNGGPMATAIIQLITKKDAYILLDLLETQQIKIDYKPNNLTIHFLGELENLSEGTYYVRITSNHPPKELYDHAIVLIKNSNSSGFIIDLNSGPEKYNDLASDFMCYLLRVIGKKEDAHLRFSLIERAPQIP